MNIADIAAIVNAGGGGGQPSGGSGYDFVIKREQSGGDTTYSLVSGDFNAIVTKIQNYEPISAYIQLVDTENQTNGQFGWFRDALYDGEAQEIGLTVWWFAYNNGNYAPAYKYLYWTPDGEIHED